MDTPWTQDAKTAWLAHMALVAESWLDELVGSGRKREAELVALARRKRKEALDELVRRGKLDSYTLV